MAGISALEQDWLMQTTGSQVREFYAQLGVGLTDRGGQEATVRCFANSAGHSHDDRKPSCSVNLLTGLFHCKGCGASGNAYHAAQTMGRDDTQARDLARQHGLFIEVVRDQPGGRPKLPGEREFKKWRDALHASAKIISRLEEVRGWTAQAMWRCGLGWDGERVVFPIRDGRLKIVGAVRYLPGGKPKSLAAPGSKRMLFPPPEVLSRDYPLFVVEGEPDAVAVWSCGHRAVAVPGTGSWRSEWGLRLLHYRVTVLADCDPQGRELAAKIAAAVPKAKVVDLDPARSDGYDVGDMVREARADGGLRQMRGLLERFAA